MAKKKVSQTKKPKTHVVIVLDKSGSMGGTKKQTIEGFNEQVQQMKMNAKDQELFCSLVTFDGDVYEHLWAVPAKDLQELSESDYTPSGGTAMRDAVGYAVQKLLSTTDHQDENNAYLVIIISDGETNSDRHYQIPALKEIIEACQSTKRWTFTYMGCSEDYLKEIAKQTSIPISNMAFWQNASPNGAKLAYKSSSLRAAKYFAGRASGQSASSNYMSDNSICSADFTQESPEVESPEVLESPVMEMESLSDNLQETNKSLKPDWKILIQKLPQYDNVPTRFSNIKQVRWNENNMNNFNYAARP